MKVLFLTDDEFRMLGWMLSNSRIGNDHTNTYGVSMDDWRNIQVQFDITSGDVLPEDERRRRTEARHATEIAKVAFDLNKKHKRPTTNRR